MTGAWWALAVPGAVLLAASLSLLALVPRNVLLGDAHAPARKAAP